MNVILKAESCHKFRTRLGEIHPANQSGCHLKNNCGTIRLRDPNPDKPEKKPLNHDGDNGSQRKILNALTSCSVVAFVVNSLLFV